MLRNWLVPVIQRGDAVTELVVSPRNNVETLTMMSMPLDGKKQSFALTCLIEIFVVFCFSCNTHMVSEEGLDVGRNVLNLDVMMVHVKHESSVALTRHLPMVRAFLPQG